jgi:hypothetical protein
VSGVIDVRLKPLSAAPINVAETVRLKEAIVNVLESQPRLSFCVHRRNPATDYETVDWRNIAISPTILLLG